MTRRTSPSSPSHTHRDRLRGPLGPDGRRTGARRSSSRRVNHVAHSTPARRVQDPLVRRRGTRSRGRATTASQNHSMSPTERATSSSYVSIPWARMNRVTFARSTYSGDGDHTTSCTPTRYNRGDGAASRGGRDRLVRLLPHHAGRLVQGADVRGRPDRLRGRRHRPPPPRSTRSSARPRTSKRARASSTSTCPDQLGAVQRPVQTVASDGLFAIATAVMLIRSGIARTVAVEAHSKASDVVSHGRIERVRARSGAQPAAGRPGARGRRARDAPLPPRERPHRRGVRRGRRREPAHARDEPAGRVRGRRRSRPPLFDPLTSEQAARSADGCVVVVLRRRGSRRTSRRGLGRRRRLEPGRAQPREPRLGRGGGRATRGRDGVPPGGDRRPATSTWPRSTTRSRTSSCSTSTRSA